MSKKDTKRISKLDNLKKSLNSDFAKQKMAGMSKKEKMRYIAR